jgi:VWFA-related protein
LAAVTAGDAPVSLALLIDTSGSAKSSIAATTPLTTSIIQALPNGSEVMAILFADGASVGLPFTSAPSVPLSFLNQVQGHGGTAFYDALIATEAYIGAHARFARRSIVVLSDCEDDASRHNLQDAVRSLQEPGTPTVYFVVQWDSRAMASEKSRTETKIKSLVSANGGIMILPNKKQDATLLGGHIASLIRGQYSVVFTASDPATDGKSHKLEVRVERPSLRISAMPLYFAPAR